MRLNSLAFRLFATAALWTLVVLPLAGLIIYSLYREDVQASFDGQLKKLVTAIAIDSIADAGKAVGEALAAVPGATPIDALVLASAARRGDVVYTADVEDLERLRAHFPTVRVLAV